MSVAGGGAEPNLAGKTTTGLMFMGAQTVLLRVVRFLGQLVLAWLLIPDDFALFGLAITIGQFVSIIRQAGVRDILIHRQASVRIWTNAAFWLTLTVGTLSGLLLAACAPLVAAFFDRTELIPLILVLAVASPFQSVMQVSMALIQAKLRFKLAAIIEAANNLLLITLTVVFALLDMGAMSFVLPLLILAIIKLVVLHHFARPVLRWNPQLRRWKYIIGDSMRLIGAGLARALVIQGDYIVLGRMFPGAAAIGHYFYAYQLSSQSVMLFGRNLDLVLFPALSKIQKDPQRQRRGFLRALRAMAVGGIPLCLLQAAVSEPAFLAMLPEKFHPSVPYIVLLSIGMAGRLMVAPSMAMMRAQGRFSTYSWMSWAYAISLVTSAAVAASLGTPLTMAAAVAANLAFWGVAFVYVALRTMPGAGADTFKVFASPLVLGAIACGLGYAASLPISNEHIWTNLVRLAVVGVVSLGIYVPAIWMVEREACRELIKPIAGKLGKLRGRGKPVASESGD